ncbi:MAG: type III-B CRISPR module-associated protein Cmr3 [Acidobacteria bacterium]|nr:type III-B CRISPR module-associated protein Cmr3 [Acidobacteriota bacterium]
MKTWIIEPHDSFIARDGRPFGLITGVRAASLPFPFPSTTTGGVRTRDGLNLEGVFDTSKENIDKVKNLSVRGALLVEIDEDEKVIQWFVHAPADALLLDAKDKDKNRAKVCRLIPKTLPTNAATNIPDDLMPLYLESKDKSKPHGYAPRFWRWDKFKKWLLAPNDCDIESLYDFGISGLPQDERSHVAIESATQASEEGKLFQTRGLEFTRQKQEKKLGTATRLALAVATDATKINKGVASLGGERRLVSWREFQGSENIFDSKCPSDIVNSVVENKACRIVLLTPAYFEQGWKPTWIFQNNNLELKAAAIQRTQVISGWDFEFVETKPDGRIIHGRPKPTRRLVPAGSVFFFKLNGNKDEIKDWISRTWMSCISDDDTKHKTTPRKDGFGLAVLGAWKEGKE